MKLMIFSGTTEGHDLCRFLSKNNVQAEVFVATEYGAAVMEPMAGITVHEGRLDEREMEKRLTSDTLLIELAAGTGVEVEVIPGITAACSGGAVLGSPLTCDFACISLSDLLTPWDKIEQRLRGAAAGDFCIALYNPSSRRRADHLARACDILLESVPPETVCGTVRSIGREGESFSLTTLGALRDTPVDMLTTVFVGNSRTVVIDGRMVTPRGYRGV